jgi:hypothetical protein
MGPCAALLLPVPTPLLRGCLLRLQVGAACLLLVRCVLVGVLEGPAAAALLRSAAWALLMLLLLVLVASPLLMSLPLLGLRSAAMSSQARMRL